MFVAPCVIIAAVAVFSGLEHEFDTKYAEQQSRPQWGVKACTVWPLWAFLELFLVLSG